MTKKTRRAKARRALLTLSLVLVMMMVAVGGTIAWLVDTSTTVTNVFTTSEVDVELAENTGNTYKMVPGDTIEKDPFVTVKATSEAAWVFVKIEKVNAFDDYMTYEMAGGWTALQGVEGVYYRSVADTDADQIFPVIKDNEVTVLDTVTPAMMNTAKTSQPTLKITAYAIQSANIDDAAAAWANFNAQK